MNPPALRVIAVATLGSWKPSENRPGLWVRKWTTPDGGSQVAGKVERFGGRFQWEVVAPMHQRFFAAGNVDSLEEAQRAVDEQLGIYVSDSNARAAA